MGGHSKRTRITDFFKSLTTTKQVEPATNPGRGSSLESRLQATDRYDKNTGSRSAVTNTLSAEPIPSSPVHSSGPEKEQDPSCRQKTSRTGDEEEGRENNWVNLWDIACARLREEEPELMNAFANDLLTFDTQPPTGGRVTGEVVGGYNQEKRLQELVLRKLDALTKARWKVTIGGKDFFARELISDTLCKVLSFKDSIGLVVSVEPHAALVWAGVLLILPLLSNPATQWEDAENGLEYISDTLIRYQVIEVNCGYDSQGDSSSKRSLSQSLWELHQQIRAKIIDIYSQILRYQIRLASQCSRGGGFRLVRDAFAVDKWNEMQNSLKETDKSIHEALKAIDSNMLMEIDTAMYKLQSKADDLIREISQIDNRVKVLQHQQLLGTLEYAQYAAFNAVKKDEPPPPRCCEGTRKEIIEEIETWVYAIARTVADRLNDEHCLGASFFFSRGRGLRAEPTAFITTLALQLAEQMPEFVTYLASAVNEHNRVGEMSLSDQWDRLILAPLSAFSDNLLMPVRLAFVIDALDECQGAEYAREIVQLLSRARELQMIELRIFVTSRNEAHIETSFKHIPGVSHRDLSLDYALDGNTTRDISIFIRKSLKAIAELHSLGEWPDEEMIQRLITKAGRLFIYASTACRYLQNSVYPERRLPQMLDAGVKGHSSTKALDDMYLLILGQVFALCTSEDRDEVALLYKQVVGSIVVMFEPPTSSILTGLFGISQRQVVMTLRPLHSLLHVPADDISPIEVFHLSFRDFVSNTSRCIDPQLQIEEREAHDILFARCILLMMERLRRDMCDLGEPGILIHEVERARIDVCIPQPVQYSCRYFASHISEAKLSRFQNAQLHEFLQDHILHWLEALTLMRRVGEAIRTLQELEDKTDASKDPLLYAFINDAKRFTLYNRATIENAPLQIYSSALVFAPQQSLIRRHFLELIPEWIITPPEVAPDWSALLQGINDIAISPDSATIVSVSGNRKVRLWDVDSGHPIDTLEGHEDWVDTIAFSPLGGTVASGSGDRTVRIWDARTGDCLRILHGHEHSASSVAFSPDGKLLASASYDRTIRLWDTSTGAIFRILRGHDERIRAVHFSPDGRTVASGANDRNVRLWDVEKGCTFQILQGHRDIISSLAFSPDGTVLASGSEDKTVRLWDLRKGTSHVIDCHLDWVHDISFSRNGNLMATASADRTVKVWDIATASVLLTLKGHSDWATAATFSWDSKMVISASFDRTIRIWDAESGVLIKVLDNSRVPEVLFTAGRTEGLNETGMTMIQLKPTERFISNLSPLLLEGDWITHAGRKILFLPAEYRPY
ncbi:hypothetical protein BJX76DRAFT_354244 [Aspergillus varians]